MAHDKDERSNAAARKSSELSDDPAKRQAASRAAAREPGTNGGNGGTTAMGPARRRQRYLIGVRALPPAIDSQRTSMDSVLEYLGRQEGVEVIKRIRLRAQPFVPEGAGEGEVILANIEQSKVERLRAAAPQRLIIEEDVLLDCADTSAIPMPVATLGTMLPLRSVPTEIAIRVLGERDQPLSRAAVVVYGRGLPAMALTDESGTARMTFFGGTADAVQALCVRAPANYWDRFIVAPRLNSHGVTPVKLRALSELFRGSAEESFVGWGPRLMGLDNIDNRFRGTGVRVGVIDSGCDNSHGLLHHVTHGKDFTEGSNESSWTEDAIAHGTPVCAIIAGGGGEHGMSGFAPDSELHVFKVFPGGRTSDLLQALDECIQRELDVVNISATTEHPSELVAMKLQELRQRGVVCIAAAGNLGGPLAFPAMLPGVIAVGAVGKLREFPSDSCHALSVLPQLISTDGVFAARFSNWGPQLAVTAPGVAIVSAVPGGYAAADGTSAAAAHVTGIAALVLAHHPLLSESPLRVRAEQRVQVVTELIRASALPRFADPQREGAGVPDLRRVPGELMSGVSRASLAGTPGYWPQTAGASWNPVVPMRAAGLF